MSVSTHLENTASNLVLSETEKQSINTSISTLKSRVPDYFKALDLKEQLQFGSSTRGTILPRKADSQSDIDYMIIFNNSSNYKPQTFIDRLKRFAEDKFTTSQIYQSHHTVVLELNHIRFELVPAYKGSWLDSTYYIPGPSSGFSDWITTDPNGFNDQLSRANQSNNNKIKPMIRLVKYWNALNGYVYETFPLEKDIVAHTHWFCYTVKDYFFSAMDSLNTWDLPSYKKDKVSRAKELIQYIKNHEANNRPITAEAEIKKTDTGTVVI